MAKVKQHIARKFFLFLSGDGISFLLNILIYALLLRRLNPTDYGCYAIGQSICLWVVPLVQMSTVATGVHLLSHCGEKKWEIVGDIISLRILIALIAASSTITIAVMIKDVVLASFLIALTPVFIIHTFQLDFVAIHEGKAWIYSLSRITASVVFLIAVICFLDKSTPVYWIPLFQGTGIFIAICVQHYLLRARFFLRWSLFQVHKRWRRLIRITWGALAAQLTQRGYYSIDLLLMGFLFHIDKKAIGEYAAASRLIQIAVVPMVSTLMTITPLLNKSLKNKDLVTFNKLKKTLAITCCSIGFAGAFVLWTTGTFLLNVFSGRQMSVSSEVLPIFAIVYLVIGLHSSKAAVLPFLGLGNVLLLVNSLGFLIATIMNLLLIPRLGPFGAGISCLFGFVIMLLAGWAANLHYFSAINIRTHYFQAIK